MDLYLKQCKYLLDHIQQHDSVCVVLGNEACDLDSAVSAILYAHFLTSTNKYGIDVPHIPVLNISQDDFVLKTEVVHFLGRFGIASDHLIFRNQINLASLNKNRKLKLVLVDHNVLSHNDAVLDSAVVEIIDHHQLEHPVSEKITMVVEPVGSCCSLIALFILEKANNLLTADLATLLIGTIVLDVANFSTSAKRATSKDCEAFNQLSKIVPNISSEDLYAELQKAKENISGLKIEQLLRKDVKVINSDSVNLAVCALPLLSSTLLKKNSDIGKKLQNFCMGYEYHGLVLVGIQIIQETDTIKRDIAVFSTIPPLKAKICKGLEEGEPSLGLSLTDAFTDVTHYHQSNVTATRKAILPMLKTILYKESKVSLHLPGNASGSSERNSDSSSTPNSGLYTPSNSCVDDGEARADLSPTELPEFNSGDVIARLESKRVAIPGRGQHQDDDLHTTAYPFTPKNSFVDNSFELSYQKFSLNHMDTDAISEKLRQENFFQEEDNTLPE